MDAWLVVESRSTIDSHCGGSLPVRHGSRNWVNTRCGRAVPPRCGAGTVTTTPPRHGFSLVELIVVLAVAVVLTGMLLPAMTQLRESAHRIVCSSNQRQLGQGLFMYAHDHNDDLPESQALRGPKKQPQELMRSYRPDPSNDVTRGWDGWGVLFDYRYCGAVECFYCPSHLGDHPMERYLRAWYSPLDEPIYTNYHYSGDLDWKEGNPRRLERGNEQALATDGLRTARDFNHGTGMNILFGDGAVRWREDTEDILRLLPDSPVLTAEEEAEYSELWKKVERD